MTSMKQSKSAPAVLRSPRKVREAIKAVASGKALTEPPWCSSYNADRQVKCPIPWLGRLYPGSKVDLRASIILHLYSIC